VTGEDAVLFYAPVETGNWSFVAVAPKDELHARGEDEIGRMAGAFGAMTESLREKAALAEAIAGGDLTRDVEPRSERDALGRAFRTMSERLRTMVGAVSSTAGTLSSASTELAATSDEAGRAVGEIAVVVGDVAAGGEVHPPPTFGTTAQVDRFPGTFGSLCRSANQSRSTLR
jgi:methyl-accepting chemotaxis protein